MSEVNSHLLSPMESLPKYHDDDEHQLIARKVYDKQVRNRLESLDASSMSFQGNGEVVVMMRQGSNKLKPVSLPIKSIPADLLDELSSAYQETASKIPRSWNPDGGAWDTENQRHRGTWDQNPDHPRFANIALEIGRLTRKLRIDKILYGLDVPLKDTHGNVVWEPDENGVRNYDEAVKALSRLKFSEEQLTQIETAIDKLSIQVELDDEDEFIKKP